jgi:hypothetical protein
MLTVLSVSNGVEKAYPTIGNYDFNEGPNVADILSQAKFVRPLIEHPFIPSEVEKLSEPKKKWADEIPMSNVALVGPAVQRSQGLVEVSN